jgi:hypothetical protein
MRMRTIAFAIVASGYLASGIAAAADPAPAAPAAPAADGKKIDWAKMSVAEKKKYMKATVLPTMKKLFVEVDPKRYKSMNCATCHGKKAAEVKFKMPSAELPKLPGPTDQKGFMALQQKKPDVVKFMGTKVKPTMASLLGLEEWSPTKTDGFGCYNCHSKEETAAKAADPAAMPKPATAAAPAAGKPAAPAPGKPAAGGW